MTLRHIQIFVSVYQNGGITKASAALHLAQKIELAKYLIPKASFNAYIVVISFFF